jgi:succinate dehydrogenase/fumarate reductase-like Fe-S protein
MKRRIQSKIQYDKKASRPLKDLAVDDRDYVKPMQKHKPWIYEKVIERPDERSCVMQTPLGLVRRNRKHIGKIKGESSEHQVRNEQFMDIVSLPDIESDD